MIMSEHMGVDSYKDRSATVINDSGQYYVAYYKNDKLISKIQAVHESEADGLAEDAQELQWAERSIGTYINHQF